MRDFELDEDDDAPAEGSPTWMATFADMATLLLTFFVLLLSFANVDVTRFRVALGSVKDALGVQFEHPGDVTALATADITSSQNTNSQGVVLVSPPAGGGPSPVGGGFEAVPAAIIVSSLPGMADPGQGVSARLDLPGFEPLTVRLYLTGDTLVVVVPDEAAMHTEFDGEALRRLAEETLGPEAAGITAIRVVVAGNA